MGRCLKTVKEKKGQIRSRRRKDAKGGRRQVYSSSPLLKRLEWSKRLGEDITTPKKREEGLISPRGVLHRKLSTGKHGNACGEKRRLTLREKTDIRE